MDDHHWKWFVLFLLGIALGMPTPTPFTECETCNSEACNVEILSCLKKISEEGNSIRDTIFDSSSDIKELSEEIKKGVRKIHDSIRKMIKAMRGKGENGLTDDQKNEKFETEDNLKEIQKISMEVLFTKDVGNKNNMFASLIPLNEKLDNEVERLSQTPVSSGDTGKTTPPPGTKSGTGDCEKCSPQCLQETLMALETDYFEAMPTLTGEDLFKKLGDVVDLVEDKKIELQFLKSQEESNTIMKECYKNHIEDLEDLYEKGDGLYIEIRKLPSNELDSFSLTSNRKLKNLAKDVKNLLSRSPQAPGCVLGKLEETIKEMKTYQKRLEGDNAEKPRVNSGIGDDLYNSVENISSEKRNAADGACEDTWGDFFVEKLRDATWEVANESKTGYKRKYTISQTNLQKAIAKHIKLLEMLKSEEEKKTSTDDSNETNIKDKDEDDDKCYQNENSQLNTYSEELNKLKLDTYISKADDTDVKEDAKEATDNLKKIIYDLEERESSLIRIGGNKCQEERKNIGIYRSDLDECKDKFKEPKKRADFTVLKTCVEKVEDKIKKRRNDLLRSQINTKFGK